MKPPDEMRRLTDLRATRPIPQDPGPDCLAPETIAQLVDGALPGDARLAATHHLAQCAVCRRAVVSVTRAMAEPAIAESMAPLPPRSGFAPRLKQLGGVAAIAAVLLIYLWPVAPSDAPTPHRAAPITAAPAPMGLWPSGTVAEARTLHWAPVPGAMRYRVTLFDSGGAVQHEVASLDTSIALPASLPLIPGRRYWWTVQAMLGANRWVSSSLVEFTIGSEAGTP
ncbi:MAG: hypothetical protein ABJC19_07505 [Gemmatimonadota bacterium]